MEKDSKRVAYIVDGRRTPFMKAAGAPNDLPAADLAINAIKNLLADKPITAKDLDEVVAGCVVPSPKECNIARVISCRIGCGDKVTAYSVQRNCASGMQAIHNACMEIWLGNKDLIVAGGTEAMSRSPIMFSDDFTGWLAKFMTSKKPMQKLMLLPKFKLKFLRPVYSILLGLADHVVNMSMGQTAEEVAYQYSLTRKELDEYSVQSHKKVMAAQEKGYFNDELTVIADSKGNAFAADNGVRQDSSVEKLGKLKPVFEKPFGKITPGNSSQITDGAAFVLLASEEAVKKHSLKVLGKVVDVAWSGLDPRIMGMGPAYSIGQIMNKHNLKLSDVDFFEINEAFAAQVIGSVHALDSDEFCKEELGLSEKIGRIQPEQLNVDGGAIALGHPVGATGARITIHLLNILKRNNAKRGIASLCIGGGQGGAILVETC